MLELLFFLGLLFLGAFLIVGILKFLVAMVLLPIKAAFWLTKGLVGLLIAVPLAILGIVVIVGAFPAAILLLMAPVILVAVAVGALAKLLFFC